MSANASRSVGITISHYYLSLFSCCGSDILLFLCPDSPGIDPTQTGVLASVETQTFQVLQRSEYTAPYITDISRHFARQGVPLLLPPGVSAD